MRDCVGNLSEEESDGDNIKEYESKSDNESEEEFNPEMISSHVGTELTESEDEESYVKAESE